MDAAVETASTTQPHHSGTPVFDAAELFTRDIRGSISQSSNNADALLSWVHQCPNVMMNINRNVIFFVLTKIGAWKLFKNIVAEFKIKVLGRLFYYSYVAFWEVM